MLTTEEREELRHIMLAQIKELEDSLLRMQETVAPVEPDAAIGRISRMDTLVNAGTVELAMNESRKKLGRLRDKLDKVGSPDFGKCVMCGKWISLERLRLAPERGACVECLNKAKK